MDLTLRTATQAQAGLSENKGQTKASGIDFTNVNEQHFSDLQRSFSLPVDVTGETVDDNSLAQRSGLPEVTLSSALQTDPIRDLAGGAALNPVKAEPAQEFAGAAIDPAKTYATREFAGAAVNPVKAEPTQEFAGAALNPVKTDPTQEFAGAALNPVKTDSTQEFAGAALNPVKTEPAQEFAGAAVNPVKMDPTQEFAEAALNPVKAGPTQKFAGAAHNPVKAEPMLEHAEVAIAPVKADATLEPAEVVIHPVETESMSELAEVAIAPVKADAMLELAGVAIDPLKAIPTLNPAGAVAVAPVKVDPDAVFEQVQRLALVHKRALSPSSSLASRQQDTFSRSAAVGHAISLSNSNSNMQSSTNLPVNLSAAVDNVMPSQAILTSPVLPIDNPAGKIMEWAKVDLTHASQQIESKEAASSRIGGKLLGILHDRINLQASNNIKSAQIRLDPPDLGMITLNVRIEGDKVNVNIASQSSVVREAIIQTSDRLRHDLVSQNFVNVSVDISSGEQREAKKEHHHQSQITSNTFNPNEPEYENGRDEFIVKV